MNIKIIDKNGVTLKTKGKYCKEDISVSVDESLMGGGNSVKLERLDFERNHTIMINDTEIQTYSYQLTAEQRAEIWNMIGENTKVHGLGIISTIDLGGDSIQYFMKGSYGFSGSNAEDTEMNIQDSMEGGYIAFDITRDKLMYLSEITVEGVNVLDQYINYIPEVYIIIPQE